MEVQITTTVHKALSVTPVCESHGPCWVETVGLNLAYKFTLERIGLTKTLCMLECFKKNIPQHGNGLLKMRIDNDVFLSNFQALWGAYLFPVVGWGHTLAFAGIVCSAQPGTSAETPCTLLLKLGPLDQRCSSEPCFWSYLKVEIGKHIKEPGKKTWKPGRLWKILRTIRTRVWVQGGVFHVRACHSGVCSSYRFHIISDTRMKLNPSCPAYLMRGSCSMVSVNRQKCFPKRDLLGWRFAANGVLQMASVLSGILSGCIATTWWTFFLPKRRPDMSWIFVDLPHKGHPYSTWTSIAHDTWMEVFGFYFVGFAGFFVSEIGQLVQADVFWTYLKIHVDLILQLELNFAAAVKRFASIHGVGG